MYSHPDEIDIFIGGISEKALPGAILGPTFVCIVGDQFSRLRRGDRFFYEEPSARFTEGMKYNTVYQIELMISRAKAKKILKNIYKFFLISATRPT